MYRWAVYFRWKDEHLEDSFNCETAKERDECIKDMLSRNDFAEIRYCRIYASGEYGIDKVVL